MSLEKFISFFNLLSAKPLSIEFDALIIPASRFSTFPDKYIAAAEFNITESLYALYLPDKRAINSDALYLGSPPTNSLNGCVVNPKSFGLTLNLLIRPFFISTT